MVEKKAKKSEKGKVKAKKARASKTEKAEKTVKVGNGDDEKPLWCKYSAKEVNEIIMKLAKKGMSASRIGFILRDSYGIPSVRLITGKSVQEILKEKNLEGEVPQDLKDLVKKAKILEKHFSENKHDLTSKRGLQLTRGKIDKLARYYKKKGSLDSAWSYKNL